MMYRVLNWLLDGIVPSVDFNAAPTSGNLPLTVAMTGTVVGMVQPYTVTWDFGDGRTATGPVVKHTYGVARDYSVVLTATTPTWGIQVVSRTLTLGFNEGDTPDTPSGNAGSDTIVPSADDDTPVQSNVDVGTSDGEDETTPDDAPEPEDAMEGAPVANVGDVIDG